MSVDTRKALRDLLCIRLRATAVLHTNAAAALGKPEHSPLRKTFLYSAGLMLEAAKELDHG